MVTAEFALALITGEVTDAETKQPLEGASVFATLAPLQIKMAGTINSGKQIYQYKK